MSEATTFIPPHALNTAVLFLVFNRLDTTMKVFEAIRQAKPPRLYVAADGARTNKEGEADKAQAVRDYIMQNIDWECEVKTLFREENLGCKYAVSGAITWFFENEEQGIILEDDCLPSQSFFWFCEELLNKYKDDLRVWHISGNNFDYKDNSCNENDILFSMWSQVWGWATWKSRWNCYDVEFERSNDELNSLRLVTSLKLFDARRLLNRFNFSGAGDIDTWDYQWHATVIWNHGLCVYPFKNLISNLGDGEDATHTISDKRARLPIYELTSKLSFPNNALVDSDFDLFIKKKMHIVTTSYQKLRLVLVKIYRLFK